MHKVRTLVVAMAMVLAAHGAMAQCCGDCSGDGEVTVDEILTTVNLALGGCPAECIIEGHSGAVVPGALPCCEGLVEIGCDAPDAEDKCEPKCVGAFFCTKCGDGTCGPGENKCNCPADCTRFVDNGDGTITDHWTGLMWEKKSNDGSIHDVDDRHRWSTGSPWNPDGSAFTEFIATLNTQAFAGHTDWRLPTIHELETLRNLERFDPAIDPVFHNNCVEGCRVTDSRDPPSCSCVASNFYWSATTDASSPSNAWVVDFLGGGVGLNGKTGTKHVRAVRGGL